METGSSDVTQLERRISHLDDEVALLRGRIAALESGETAHHRRRAPPTETPPQPATATVPDAREGPGLAVLVGRTCVVMGGAFLLRALTESGTVSDAMGVALGLAYAGLWVFMADRLGRRGATVDAVFHGFAAAAIANPLLFEATTRFTALTPFVAAMLVLLLGGALLFVATQRRLRALAWVAVTAAMLTGGALLFRTGAAAPFCGVLLAFTAAALGISYHRGWVPLRWTVALVMDALVITTTVTFLRGVPGFAVPAAGVVGLQVAFALVCLFALAFVTVVQRRPISAFEAVQSAVAVGIGLFATQPVLAVLGVGSFAVPLVAAVLAVACYALVALRWRTDHGANLACYGALGALLAVSGLHGIAAGAPAALGWATIAVVGVWLTRRSSRGSLRVSGAALVLAAAVESGLLRGALRGIGIGGGAAWPPLPAGALAVLVLTVAAYVAMRAEVDERTDGWRWTTPAFILAMASAWGLGGALVVAVAPAVAFVGTPQLDGAALAVLRTGVLIALVWVLGWGGRSRRRPELLWAAYATLGYTVLRIVVDDLPRGRPTTLFMTFVLLGSTLMVLPKIVRRPSPVAPAEPVPVDVPAP